MMMLINAHPQTIPSPQKAPQKGSEKGGEITT